MIVAGVVAEYNPFHNGHAHHLKITREATGCDYVVAIMSGSFVQRGEVAIADKWVRAHTALENGADAVFELPVLHALRAAPDFAMGSVSHLSALGVVTHLSFGSEVGLEALHVGESAQEGARVRALMSTGISYPRALYAVKGAPALGKPNATLGVEYLRAIERLNAPIIPVAVPRSIPRDMEAAAGEAAGMGGVDVPGGMGSYDDAAADVQKHMALYPADGRIPFATASAIRHMLRRGEDASPYMPECTHLPPSERPSMAALEGILLDTLRGSGADMLGTLLGAGEGLERRAGNMAREASSYEELTVLIKCKRYTMARIRRFLAAALLGITSQMAQACAAPRYMRLLGFRRDAAPLLGAIKGSSSVPIIAKAAAFDRMDPVFRLDVRAQDMQALAYHGSKRRAGLDFVTSPVVVP